MRLIMVIALAIVWGTAAAKIFQGNLEMMYFSDVVVGFSIGFTAGKLPE